MKATTDVPLEGEPDEPDDCHSGQLIQSALHAVVAMMEQVRSLATVLVALGQRSHNSIDAGGNRGTVSTRTLGEVAAAFLSSCLAGFFGLERDCDDFDCGAFFGELPLLPFSAAGSDRRCFFAVCIDCCAVCA